MKNGFELINSLRAECYRNGFLMVDVQYSLRDQYAVFSARPVLSKKDGNEFSTHLYRPDHGMVSGQYGLSKAEASKSLIQRFDDLQGGAQ